MFTLSSQRFFLAGMLLMALLPLCAGACMAQQESLKPRISEISISPDGKRFVIIKRRGAASSFVISAAPQLKGRELATFKSGYIGYPRWCFDDRHLLFTMDREGNGNTHIYRADLISGGAADLTPEIASGAELLALSPLSPNEALITVRNSNLTCPDVYRLNLDKCTCAIDTKNDGKVTSWIADNSLRVRGAIKSSENGGCSLEIRDNPSSSWHQVMKWEKPVPAENSTAFSRDGKKLFIVGQGRKGSDCLLRIDCATGRKTVIYDGKGDAINGFTLTADGMSLEAVSLLKRAHTVWNAVDSSMAPRYELLRQLYRADTFSIQSRSCDNTRWIIKYTHEEGHYRIYLYNFKSGKASLLVDSEAGQ